MAALVLILVRSVPSLRLAFLPSRRCWSLPVGDVGAARRGAGLGRRKALAVPRPRRYGGSVVHRSGLGTTAAG